MKPTTRLCSFAIASLVSANAHAWVALAFDQYAGVTYLARTMEGAAQAEGLALEVCRQRVAKAQCTVVSKAPDGSTLVIVRGINALNGRTHVTSAVNQDPLVARRTGLDECRSSGSIHCTVVDAVWDAAQSWGALARGEDVFYYVGDAATAGAARDAALQGCEARTTQPGSCTVVGPSVSNAHAWVVFVESEQSKYFAYDADRSVAVEEGMAACRGTASKPQHCHVVAYHENAGVQPAPDSFSRLEAEARQGKTVLSQARNAFNRGLAARPSAREPGAGQAGADAWYANLRY